VRLAGRDPIAIFVFHCQDVITELATMLLNATVMKNGREPIVIFQAATTVPMDIAFHPMNAFATMDGKAAIVILARKWRDAFMDLAEPTHTPVSVRKVGKDIYVTKLHATSDVNMDFVMHPKLQEWPTFVSVRMDGEENTVKNAGPTGNAPTRIPMLVTCPMSVFALEETLIPWACATIPSLFIT
jgi:hypothetical protein